MHKLKDLITKLLNVITGASFIAMVALTFMQVLMRYVFKSPLTWSEELVSYLFAWASLLGACLVTGERGHMNIPVVLEKMPASTQKALAILAELIAFIFSVVILVFGGIQIAKLTMGQMTSSLGVPVGIFYVLMPAAGILNAIYAGINMIDIAKGTEPAVHAE